MFLKKRGLMNIMNKLYERFFVKSGFEYANYLKKRKILNRHGENCFISKGADISDPYLTRIGDNVWITDGCKLLCHDASVIMLNKADDTSYDKVGPIFIGDNSFIGNNTIIMPGVNIGESTIIGAGSVVTRDVCSFSVWGGNPANFLCHIYDYKKKIKKINETYPWKNLVKNRLNGFEINLEEKLKGERVRYFYT